MVTSKRVHFLTGLPRTGSTLLAALLNQHERVYVSTKSELPDYLFQIEMYRHHNENEKFGVARRQHDSFMTHAASAYYATTPADVVVDKSVGWGNPYYLNLVTRYTGQPPRLLCLVRPLTEVVASFVYRAQQNADNYIDRTMREQDFLPYWRKPIDDARVDWLLRPGAQIDTAMLSVHSALATETRDQFHVVQYADLVGDPDKTLDGIYDFLDVPRLSHDLTAIPSGETYYDEATGMPDLHRVRSTLSVQSPDPEAVLSDYGLTRCALDDFWTERL